MTEEKLVENFVSAVIDSDGRIIRLVSTLDNHYPDKDQSMVFLGSEASILRTPEGDFVGPPPSDPTQMIVES